MEIEIVYPSGMVKQTITDRIRRDGKIYELLSACRSPGLGLSVIYVAAEELAQRLAPTRYVYEPAGDPRPRH